MNVLCKHQDHQDQFFYLQYFDICFSGTMMMMKSNKELFTKIKFKLANWLVGWLVVVVNKHSVIIIIFFLFHCEIIILVLWWTSILRDIQKNL